MSKTIFAVLGSMFVLGSLVFLLMRGDIAARGTTGFNEPGAQSSSGGAEIALFCAASNRAVMEAIRQEYEAETGRRVSIQYGSSQTLLSQFEISGTGDLYLPADDSFLKLAADKGLTQEVLSVATMRVGLAVKKGNPLQIDSLADLLQPQIKLVQSNPEAAAVAKLTKEVLTDSGDWEAIDKATTAYRATVTDVTNDLVVGAADVGIVYDAVLHSYPDLEFVELPEFKHATSKVAMAVLTSSTQVPQALHFARYVSASDRGLELYEAHGFQTQRSDSWADAPEISVYAGSMLRPAIEDTIVEFEKREGVTVSRVYNGCGILVAQMKAGQHPDAYFACDSEFMQQVTDLFPESVDVSQNELVIMVQKGNPKSIATLKDLTREGLRVGIGHEKQCAMGWITQNTFREGGIQTEVMQNVTVQTPSGDMLVNQLRTGSLDAAVAYLSNAAGAAEHLDAIRIQGISCATATQPWAVAKESKYPQLTSRLFAKICSVESKETFTAEGFTWRLNEGK